jgi:hypothetical protein
MSPLPSIFSAVRLAFKPAEKSDPAEKIFLDGINNIEYFKQSSKALTSMDAALKSIQRE